MTDFVYPAHRYKMLTDPAYADFIRKMTSEGLSEEQASRVWESRVHYIRTGRNWGHVQ